MKAILTKKYFVGINDIDANFTLSPRAALLMLQDATTIHAEKLNVSYEKLKAAGLFWVISKIKAVFTRKISLCETLKVITWPLYAPKSRMFAGRDYLIQDEKGEVVLRATSKWCILSLKDRSLCRLSDFPPIINPKYSTARALDLNIKNPNTRKNSNAQQDFDAYEKITKTDDFKHCYTHEVVWTDIDINRHVNNTRYLDFAVNALTEQENTQGIKSFEITFVSEIKQSEKIEVFKFRSQNNVYIIGEVNHSTAFVTLLTLNA